MAYTRENLLLRMIEVQRITLEQTKKGVSQEWLWKNVFNKTPWNISRKTYYNWLGEPAKKQQLKKIQEAKQMQMQLF